jgi:hypothetical protein
MPESEADPSAEPSIEAPVPPPGLPPIHESLLPRDHALHRPRHGRTQRTALICAVVFLLVPAVSFVFGVRPQAFENHELAPFPSLADGGHFFTGLPAWATDHLPLREAGVRAETGISQGVFGEPPAFSGTDRQSGGTPLGPVNTNTAPQDNASSDDSQVIAGTNDWLYLTQDMTAKCAPTQPLGTTVAALRQLRAAIDASGRTLVLAVAPDKSTVVPQHLPADYPDKQCAASVSRTFWSDVTGTDGALDLRAGLAALAPAERRPAYYPQDTHWTDLGALYMLRRVADAITPGVSSSWTMRRAATTRFPADLPLLIARTGTNTDINYHLSPDGGGDQTVPPPGTFLRPLSFTRAATTGMVTTPTAILGDSFLDATLRYLPAAFSDVTAFTYGGLAGDPVTRESVESVMASGKVIVIEVVERSLAGGLAPFLQPAVISGIKTYLAAHPLP